MLEKIQLLRNVGQFDSVNGTPADLTKLTLFYAENGRGKTTLASIFRSVRTGNAALIDERHRLTAQHPPHIVLRDASGPATFQNGAWSRQLPEIVVFDDQFVSENVCSGIELETEHRQNLHGLILGAQGVTLNAALQGHVAAIEEHNRRLRSLSDAIPAMSRGRLSVDAYCALERRPGIDQEIAEAERSLSAAKSADSIRSQAAFQSLDLPGFDTGDINDVLQRDLATLEAAAASMVQDHFAKLGKGGEAWVAEGVPRIIAAGEGEACPFCAQGLQGSALIPHYRAYFSQAYSDLKAVIVEQGQGVAKLHGGDALAAFERAVLVATQAHEFWSAFTAVPAIGLDTVEIARAWVAAREGVLKALRAKLAAPLERMALQDDVITAIAAFERCRLDVAEASARLQAANDAIVLIKEQTASANVVTLQADLDALKTLQARHTAPLYAACQAYLDEKAAKAATETARDRTRADLDRYRTTVFPAYENAINQYLRRFGASFRLNNVVSVSNRGGSSCTYSVLINDVPVSVTAASGPSFRNTLSAGDRNTLALAFFFASLEQDAAALGQKILVIDDPMTSLDEHRNRNTLHELRQMLNRVDQMIVLSHSKPFLCPLWENAAVAHRSAFRIDRVRVGQNEDASTITLWDVHSDCVSDNDRRHEQALAYMQRADPAIERAVAESLRPMLEAFVRVAYPPAFPPGTLFRSFLSTCERSQGRPDQLLNQADIAELRYLLEYANEFHHDTNPAYQTVMINSQELTDFCRRTITFIRRA